MGDLIDSYINNIIVLASIGDNWDSYDGIEPSEEVVSNVKNFATNMATKYDHRVFKHMYVFPTRNGGVQLEFERGNNYFEIEFLPSGSLSIFSELDGRCIEKNNVDYDYASKMLDSFIKSVIGV